MSLLTLVFYSFSGFCLFFLFWLLSFLLFVKCCWEATNFLLAFLPSSSSTHSCFLSSTNASSLSFTYPCFLSSTNAFLSSSSLSSTYPCFLSSTLTSFHVPHTSCHAYFSSLLGPSMDLGLDLELSASLYISFLRISATCCVSWTNRLFGKASPMNGFDVSLPATV